MRHSKSDLTCSDPSRQTVYLKCHVGGNHTVAGRGRGVKSQLEDDWSMNALARLCFYLPIDLRYHGKEVWNKVLGLAWKLHGN